MKYSQFGLLIAVLHILTSYIVPQEYSTMLFIMSILWLISTIPANFMENKIEKNKMKRELLEFEHSLLTTEAILTRLDILIALQTKDKDKIKLALDKWEKRLKGKDKVNYKKEIKNESNNKVH